MFGRTTAERRNRRRLPHWLALLAVAVQLFASFGHIHPEDYDFLWRGHSAPMLNAGDGPSPVSAPDQDCIICAAVYLAANSTVPDAIALPAPRTENIVSVAAIDELWLTPRRHLLFSTRGPPLI